MYQLLETALQYYNAGIQLVPLPYGKKESKRINYNSYLKNPQTKDDIERLFGHNKPRNIGWASGVRSCNLVTLDFEAKYDAFKQAIASSCRFKEICDKTTVTMTAHNGYHVHVRLRNPEINKTGVILLNGEKVGDLKYSGYTVEPYSVLLEDGNTFSYTFLDGFKGILEIDSLGECGLGTEFSLQANSHSTSTSDSSQNIISLEARSPKNLIVGYGDKYKKILEGKYDRSEYPSRSEAENAVMTRGIDLGQTADEIWSIFVEYGNDKILKFLQSGRKAFNSNYNRTYQFVKSNQQEGDTSYRDYSYLIDKIGSEYSKQQKRVIAGIILILNEVGPEKEKCLGISERELAQKCGVSKTTVHRYLSQLGITCLEKSHSWKASLYDVSSLVFALDHSSTDKGIPFVEEWSTTESNEQSYILPLNSDVNRIHALGGNALQIISTLKVDSEKTVNEWGALWGDTYSSAKRKLYLLDRAGIVVESPIVKRGKGTLAFKVLQEITPEKVAKICTIAGTKGLGEKQIQQYNADRSYNQYKLNLLKAKKRGATDQNGDELELPEYRSFSDFVQRFTIKNFGEPSTLAS